MPSRCATDGLRRAQSWLGTLVAIHIRDAGDCRDAHAACDAAFAAVGRVQALMSFHDPSSELSVLNRRAWRQPVPVSPWTWAVLARAAELGEATGGLFDCAVAPQLVRRGLLPGPAADEPCAWRRGYDGDSGRGLLEFLPDSQVRFRAPLLLDLGGIAKGFAVDCAVEALRAHGIAAASVNAGGDLRVFGDAVATIGVRQPGSPGRVVPLVNLRDAALATSAHYPQVPRGPRQAELVTPFIDPRTGACCGHGISVTVVAPDCMTADALTKVLLVSRDHNHPALAAFGGAARMLFSDDARAACA